MCFFYGFLSFTCSSLLVLARNLPQNPVALVILLFFCPIFFIFDPKSFFYTMLAILEQLNLKRELLRCIKSRKLRFYGHAYRADGIAKTAICGIYPEKRRRGRPRRQYEDNIREWLDCSVAESVRIVLNRERSTRKVETVVRKRRRRLISSLAFCYN